MPERRLSLVQVSPWVSQIVQRSVD